MFQVESRAQMATLPRLKPEKFYDLVVEVAIIRPGPIVGQMVHPYLRRRQGKEPADPLHPSLEPVLARTLGVPLFQEQLLRMAMIAASFTGGEAEELRRAMGFKRSEAAHERHRSPPPRRHDAQRHRRRSAGQDRALDHLVRALRLPRIARGQLRAPRLRQRVFEVHYLAAFTCALLNNQPMGFYSPAMLIKDAQRHGLRILPVDVNSSDWPCTIDQPALRLGLRYVRGLRAEAGHAIAERRPYTSVDDLAHRVPELRKNEIDMLAAVGALAKLGTLHRRDALWKAGRAGRPTGPLLEHVPETAAEAPLGQMTIQERLAADYEGTSLTIGRHPMHYLREKMNALGVTPAADLPGIRNGGLVRVAGCVVVRQRPGTAKGILFISLEDETGIFNAVVLPEVFDAYRLTILTEQWLLIEGKIQNVEGVIHVLAKRFERLEPAAPASPSHDFH